MQAYIYPIATAAAIFPLLSALFTLPYVITQYHKYGALLVLRIILVYSFIFYMLTSYFMTILPLPPVESVTSDTTTLLLEPFHALKLWWSTSGFVAGDISTYPGIFINYNFLQIAFNIVLLLPLGVYLRYYFEKRWYQVLILSFAYSLFFELTQLSGLYGIYPYPYRWFEVDDLICNTLGGIIGFIITPALSFFLPSRERLDVTSYRKGRKVSLLRKAIANLTDWGIIIGLLILFRKSLILDFKPQSLMIITFVFFAYYTLSALLTRGRSIGKYLVSLRIADYKKRWRQASVTGYIIRYGIFYLIALPSPAYILKLMQLFYSTDNVWIRTLSGVVSGALLIHMVFFVMDLFLVGILHHEQAFFEKLSSTIIVSTVVIPEDEVRAVEKEDLIEAAEEAESTNVFEENDETEDAELFEEIDADDFQHV